MTPDQDQRADRPTGLIVTAALLITAIIAAAIGLWATMTDSSESTSGPHADVETTTSADAATTSSSTTTEDTPTTTAAERSVLDEPPGQLCRDLSAKGYTYAEAVSYWEHHGRPSRMDASGTGIPCQTVYPRSDVEARWGSTTTAVDLTSPLLWGYPDAMAIVEADRSLVHRAQTDLTTLSEITGVPWTLQMLVALASSYCNDWDRLPELGPSEQGIDDWSEAIAPVLGISESAATAAILSDLWSSYQYACE